MNYLKFKEISCKLSKMSEEYICKKCGSSNIEEDYLFHDRIYEKGCWLIVCLNCEAYEFLSEDSYKTRNSIENGNHNISFSHLIGSRNLFQKALLTK